LHIFASFESRDAIVMAHLPHGKLGKPWVDALTPENVANVIMATPLLGAIPAGTC
jgi:hypothetical protein